jgi:glutathione synthase/RimK-type ligase-like ATP-grasp enzyme
MFHDNARRFVTPLAPSSADLIFVYKMEGFYFDLPRFFQMVQMFAESAPLVINHPATIRHNIDKRYLLELERKGILIPPTGLMNDSVRERVARGEPVVLKPINGERGKGVMLVKNTDELAAVEGFEEQYLVQDYVPGVRAGEISFVFLGFEYQFAFLKKAVNPDEFRCNASQGGMAVPYEPTPAEMDFALRTLRAYESLGCPVHYSRIDLIRSDRGPVLMEAELINPSIFARYFDRGEEFGKKLAAYFDRLLKNR